MPNVYVRTVRRTAELLGGVEPLAAHLKVKPIVVRAWMDGAAPVPANMFLACVDYLGELTARSAGPPRGRDSQP